MEFSDIVGFEEVEVVFRDGVTKEVVRVRQFGLEECPTMLRLMAEDDETKLIAFYTQKDPAWAARLMPQSQEQILEVGERLNKDFFEHWLQRRRRHRAMLLGSNEEQDLIKEAIAEAAERVMKEASDQILQETSSDSPPQPEDRSKS